MLRRLSFAACLTVLALLSALRADAQLPKPKEDVTKLTKPTISYKSYDGYEFRLMDLDGTNDRLWLGDGKARFSGSLEWSPDGKRASLIMFEDDGSHTPYVIDLRTGDVQNLRNALPNPKGKFSTPPTWSPDGKARFSGSLEWSPDGKRASLIMFEDDGSHTPYVIDLRTGDVQNLRNALPNPKGKFSTPPTWSPDGKWIAICDTWYVTNVIVHGTLYKVNVYNGKVVQLTNTFWLDPVFPSWSSDGKKIAFCGYKEPKVEGVRSNMEIYTVNTDGSNLVNITDHPEWDHLPVWSPDGKKIVFRSFRDNQDLEVAQSVGRVELYTINPDGSDLERLTFNTGWDGVPSWSPDSQWFVHRAGPIGPGPDDQKPEGIYLMRVAAKESVLIKEMKVRDPTWVLAGESRFLSVDPAGKKSAMGTDESGERR